MFQKVVESAQMISLPDIYLKLKELIEDPDYTMAEVALLVSSDPGMSARFLRAVNSPLNRRICEITTVSHAVSLLGIHQVHDIVLSAAVAEAFKGIKTRVMNVKKYWQRSFYCAVMAKQLALECEIFDSDRLFVIGLLHDIGHMFMYVAIPEESQQAIIHAKEKEKPLYKMERELLGFDYATVGGHVMGQWALPESFQEITSTHPEPDKADQFDLETALLHLSVLLVLADLENGVFGEGCFPVDPVVWDKTHLTEEKCLAIRQTASDKLTEMENSLFI